MFTKTQMKSDIPLFSILALAGMTVLASTDEASSLSITSQSHLTPSTNASSSSVQPELMKRQGLPGVGASMNFNVDVNDFVNQITHAIKAAENREGFVNQAVETAYYGALEKKNVMVFHLNQRYDKALKNVDDEPVIFRSFNYDGAPYGVWLFDEGWFENKGDGGYINWAFQGRWERQRPDGTPDEGGKHVVFKPLRQPGAKVFTPESAQVNEEPPAQGRRRRRRRRRGNH